MQLLEQSMYGAFLIKGDAAKFVGSVREQEGAKMVSVSEVGADEQEMLVEGTVAVMWSLDSKFAELPQYGGFCIKLKQ